MAATNRVFNIPELVELILNELEDELDQFCLGYFSRAAFAERERMFERELGVARYRNTRLPRLLWALYIRRVSVFLLIVFPFPGGSTGSPLDRTVMSSDGYLHHQSGQKLTGQSD